MSTVARSSRISLYLGIAASALLATYVVLMVSTIMFASLQTQLAQNIQTTQMEITKLESKYYDAISTMDTVDPHALGYVTPRTVSYVAATPTSGLTFAE